MPILDPDSEKSRISLGLPSIWDDDDDLPFDDSRMEEMLQFTELVDELIPSSRNADGGVASGAEGEVNVNTEVVGNEVDEAEVGTDRTGVTVPASGGVRVRDPEEEVPGEPEKKKRRKEKKKKKKKSKAALCAESTAGIGEKDEMVGGKDYGFSFAFAGTKPLGEDAEGAALLMRSIVSRGGPAPMNFDDDHEVADAFSVFARNQASVAGSVNHLVDLLWSKVAMARKEATMAKEDVRLSLSSSDLQRRLDVSVAKGVAVGSQLQQEKERNSSLEQKLSASTREFSALKEEYDKMAADLEESRRALDIARRDQSRATSELSQTLALLGMTEDSLRQGQARFEKLVRHIKDQEAMRTDFLKYDQAFAACREHKFLETRKVVIPRAIRDRAVGRLKAYEAKVKTYSVTELEDGDFLFLPPMPLEGSPNQVAGSEEAGADRCGETEIGAETSNLEGVAPVAVDDEMRALPNV